MTIPASICETYPRAEPARFRPPLKVRRRRFIVHLFDSPLDAHLTVFPVEGERTSRVLLAVDVVRQECGALCAHRMMHEKEFA